MTGTFAPRSRCVAALCCFRLVLAHTSRTQVTQPPLPAEGKACRSRFWMPCYRWAGRSRL